MNHRPAGTRLGWLTAGGTIGLALLSMGCPPPPPNPMTLLREIDTNNRPIRRVKSDRFSVTGSRGVLSFMGEANLRHEKPRKLYLSIFIAEKKVLELGSDGQAYWVWTNHMEGASKLVHGQWAELPLITSEQMPLRPDWLIACLGVEDVGRIDETDDLPWGPLPHTHPWYTSLLYGYPDGKSGYAYTVRETRYDHRPGKPVEMYFYDADGRERMRADLSDFRPILHEDADGELVEYDGPGDPPRIAHRIRLHGPWGDLNLKLEDPFVPEELNEGMFKMRDRHKEGTVVEIRPTTRTAE